MKTLGLTFLSLIEGLALLGAFFRQPILRFVITAAALTALFSSFASAQTPGISDPSQREEKIIRALRQEIREAQKLCPQLNCPDGRYQVTPLNSIEVRDLGNVVRARLRVIAKSLALDLWPDTVLEGPYSVQYRVRLDRIARVTRGGEAIGYHLMFSDKAWNTDQCNAGRPDETVSPYVNCLSGRIFDAGFVLNDLNTRFRDELGGPNFIADAQPQTSSSKDLSKNSVRRQLMRAANRVRVPLMNNSCEIKSVYQTLVQNQELIENLIYDEKGITACDIHETPEKCYEPAALDVLLADLFPIESRANAFSTDPNYKLCRDEKSCSVNLKIVCIDADLVVEFDH